ncbi:IS1595 family transposase [Mesorhizobium caraganae]|nr:IS1595 family transposase [Mesorhizobium caraganae]
MERGGGSSTASQIWIAGAVETVGNHGVGRIRLARIADRSAQSIVPCVVANTLPGAALRTDSLASYDKVPGRRLRKVNPSNRTMPAHIVFKWIHVVFANLKRWALGTFHGFREKHLDAYLGEFAFRISSLRGYWRCLPRGGRPSHWRPSSRTLKWPFRRPSLGRWGSHFVLHVEGFFDCFRVPGNGP